MILQCASAAQKQRLQLGAGTPSATTLDGSRAFKTYRMRFIGHSGEVHHAIEACKRRAIALVAVSVELLLRKDVSTALDSRSKHLMHLQGRGPLVGIG